MSATVNNSSKARGNSAVFKTELQHAVRYNSFTINGKTYAPENGKGWGNNTSELFRKIMTVLSEIDFDKVRKGELEDLDDISFMEESSLDVDKFLSGEVLMHFPARVLCRKDCKGLCLKCGKNLNEGNCGCDRAVLDPRMSAIRDIFNSYKEV
jgi:hypothetical protein